MRHHSSQNYFSKNPDFLVALCYSSYVVKLAGDGEWDPCQAQHNRR